MIDASAFQKMRYKNCLEDLSLHKNDFSYHQEFIIWYFNYFINIKKIDISSMKTHFIQNTRAQISHSIENYGDSTNYQNIFTNLTSDQNDVLIRLPSSLEFLNASCISNPTKSPKNITVKGINRLQILDLTYSSFLDCNYTLNGFQNVNILNISHFKCNILNHNIIHSFVHLEQLTMQSSSLHIGLKNDHRSAFLQGLTHLEYIDLARNAFKYPFTFSTFKSQQDSLQSLILEGNLFTRLPVNIDDFSRLSLLDIRNNKIAYLTKIEIYTIEQLFKKSNRSLKFFLDGNRFVCNCNSLDFVEWLFTTNVDLDRSGNYSCANKDGNLTTNAVYKDLRDIRINCISTIWLFFSASLFCLLVVFSLVGYRYKRHIQYSCLFIKITNPPYRTFKGNTLEYDAYVSYCDSDYDWIKNHLFEFLEKRHKYRLFLYKRDGFAGLEKHSAFKESISKCKKIIYVISRDFINDIDSNQEFTMGQQHFLGLQTKIIVINFEGIRHTE